MTITTDQTLSAVRERYAEELTDSLDFLEMEYHNCEPWEFFETCEIIEEGLRGIVRGRRMNRILRNSYIRELRDRFMDLKIKKNLENTYYGLPRMVN